MAMEMAVGLGKLVTAANDFNTLVTAGKSIYKGLNQLRTLGPEFVLSRMKADTKGHVRYDPKYLVEKAYFGERAALVDRVLPYSKLIVWKDANSIEIKQVKTQFKLKDGDDTWNRLREKGLIDIEKRSRVYDNPEFRPIRLSGWNSKRGVLTIQPALYSQQARSNLLADFEPTSGAGSHVSPSFRTRLIEEHGPILPPLTDRRMANTIGISALVLAMDDTGKWRPLVHFRDPELTKSAMHDTGIHCTASKVAFWPRSEQTDGIESYFDDEMYEGLKKDFALDCADVDIRPIAMVREHARLGKPQLLYFGTALKPLDEILRYYHERLKEEEAIASVHKYRHMSKGRFRDLIMKDLWDPDMYKYFTQEGMLSMRMMDELILE